MLNGKCRVHGGLTPKGIASPHYKTGTRSKYLPARLLGRVEVALDDPGLLDFRRDIALVEARLADLFGQLSDGGAAETWANVQGCYLDLRASIRRQDKNAITASMIRLDALITQGVDEVSAWELISASLDQRRRLIDSENRRIVQAQQMITMEQMTLFVNALLASIHTHVEDRKILTAIQEDVIKLLHRQSNVIDVSATAE